MNEAGQPENLKLFLLKQLQSVQEQALLVTKNKIEMMEGLNRPKTVSQTKVSA